MEVIKVRDLGFSVSKNRGIFGVLDSIPIFKYFFSFAPKSLFQTESKPILKGISFSVNKGDVFGLIGFNGSGKTTLCHILSHLVPHDEGEVSVLSKVTICNNDLFGSFDAMQNIQMGTRLFDLCPDVVNVVAKELLAKLGFDEKDLETEAVSLSFGTTAKVALVRAVIIALREGNPNPILVLDEPTRGFDVRAIREFEDSIRILKQAIPDLTMVIATNQEHELCLCNRYTALVEGKLVEDEELLERLRESYARHRNETHRTFEQMISGHEVKVSEVREGRELSLKIIPKKQKLENPFLWRAKNELLMNPVFFLIMIFTMVVPNLFPIISAVNKTWEIFIASVCGIYFTWLMRSAYRVLGRETQYYRMLNLIQVSNYKGLKHLFSATRSGILQDTFFFLIAILVLGIIFALQVGLPSVQGLDAYFCVSFILLVVCGVVFSLACGIICSPLLIGMKSDNAFFLLSIVPLMILMLSGLFYPAENQLLGFQYLSYVMPFTMLGDFLRGNRDPFQLLIAIALASAWYLISLWVYQISLQILFNAKRLKN